MFRKAKIHVSIIGHASALIKIGPLTLLCDPHLHCDFRGGLFSYHPARFVDYNKLPQLDAIVLSHSHRDHFDVASLYCLKRKVPVFCPADTRIEYVLTRLGFTEVITVTDWTYLKPIPDVELLWTPSTYRVPEHGLAIKSGELCLWNLVDTHVVPEWVDEVHNLLDCRSFDALMLPCQPLLETAIVDGVHPAVKPKSTDDTGMVVSKTSAKYVLPFADGHYCTGSATWLNHQKFPYTRRRIESLLHQANPSTKVLWADPGDHLVLSRNGLLKIATEQSKLVTKQRRRQSRTFHPGGWIEPVCSSSKGSVRALVEELIRSGEQDPPLATRLVEHYNGKLRLQECSYRLITVGSTCDETVFVDLSILEDGRLSTKTSSPFPNIEICLSNEDLVALLKGELGYSAALLGGKIREYRPGLPSFSSIVVVTGEHDKLSSPSCGVLSGTTVFNLLLSRALNPYTRELDVEIEVCMGLREGVRFPKREVYPSYINDPIITPSANRSARLIWRKISRKLAKGLDPASASGLIKEDRKDIWFGVLGRDAWPDSSNLSYNGVEGRLVIYNLIEAQPHMGAGVRFPDESYDSLVNNIVRSSIRRWTLEASLPSNVRVPRWRWASLVPFDARRLWWDLRKRGWEGEIIGSSEFVFEDRQWWLGTPQLPTRRGSTIEVEVFPNRFVRGECRGISSLKRQQLSVSHSFRLDCNFDEQINMDLLKAVLQADFRFSWLLQPDDTELLFPESQQMGFTRWTEQIALKCLRYAASSVCSPSL